VAAGTATAAGTQWRWTGRDKWKRGGSGGSWSSSSTMGGSRAGGRMGNLGRGRHALAVEVNGPWLGRWACLGYSGMDTRICSDPGLPAWRAWEQASCLGCLQAVHFPLMGGAPRALEEAGTTEGQNAPVDDARSRPWARLAPPLPDARLCDFKCSHIFFSRPLPTRWTLRCENLNGPFEDNRVCTKGVASSPNLPGHPRCREPIHLSTRPPVHPSIPLFTTRVGWSRQNGPQLELRDALSRPPTQGLVVDARMTHPRGAGRSFHCLPPVPYGLRRALSRTVS